jgi:hypothetical protein
MTALPNTTPRVAAPLVISARSERISLFGMLDGMLGLSHTPSND